MADTIGDMIDKLTIANLRLWHIEDERRAYCNAPDRTEEQGTEYLNMVSKVNKERNSLIDQINSSFLHGARMQSSYLSLKALGSLTR